MKKRSELITGATLCMSWNMYDGGIGKTCNRSSRLRPLRHQLRITPPPTEARAFSLPVVRSVMDRRPREQNRRPICCAVRSFFRTTVEILLALS